MIRNIIIFDSFDDRQRTSKRMNKEELGAKRINKRIGERIVFRIDTREWIGNRSMNWEILIHSDGRVHAVRMFIDIFNQNG